MTRTWTAAILAVAVGAPAAAQVAPPALPQVLQRNPTVNPDRINEEQRQRLQQRVNPDIAPARAPAVDAPPPAAATDKGAAAVGFTLTAVRFDPSSYLTAAELDALAKPLLGTEVTLADLQRVVDQVNALYAARGLLTARAALPAQQIEGGVVQIRLIEGRIGATGAEGGSARGRRYAQHEAALPPGTLAAPKELEGRLRLFNLNNDAQLRARLVPGATYGTTDVTLSVAEPARVSLDVFADNNGFSSTGQAEVGAVLRGFRLFGGADRATAVLVASRGVVSTSGSLSAPLGPRLRVEATGSYGHTRVKFGSLANAGVTGSSVSFGGDLAALLYAGDRLTLTGTAAVQTSLSDTNVAGAAVIRNRALNRSLGLAGSYAAPGFSASVQAQGTAAHVRERLSGTEVNPFTLSGSALVGVAIAPRVQGRVRGDWQLSTSKNLPGLLQYQIGGTRSARAYDPGIAAGDQGYAAAAELAYDVVYDGLLVEPSVFVEHAEASVPGQRFATDALGAALVLTYNPRLTVRASVASDVGRTGLPHSTRAFVSTNIHL